MNAPPEPTAPGPDGWLCGFLTAFRYPFQGAGNYILFGGALFFTAASLLSARAGFLCVLVQLGLTGYWVVYAKDVVRTSALGKHRRPAGWTFLTGWKIW